MKIKTEQLQKSDNHAVAHIPESMINMQSVDIIVTELCDRNHISGGAQHEINLALLRIYAYIDTDTYLRLTQDNTNE
ncbi:MAG: hypothetical protein GY799_25310 [Desulfobulbaceae bacterium]|nr:hypothetical protein [Desulfobulbaceae bacterium]